MRKQSNGYVTYKWLLTTIISAMTGVLLIVGGLANATFFTKSAGAAVEQKVIDTDNRLTDINIMLTEVRQDVKVLLTRKK